MTQLLNPIADAVVHDGFAFVRARKWRRCWRIAGLRDWELVRRKLGRSRRRHLYGRWRALSPPPICRFRANPAGIVRKPHQPHYQSQDYNPLNGGIERWFEPVTETIAATRH